MGQGVERAVGALARDNRGWVGLGLVTAADAHASLGYLLTVELQPSGREVQARLIGRRLLLAADVGDEVLVLVPDGDPNRAVALPAELVSFEAPLPSSWTNGGPQVVDPDGLEVRTSGSATVQALVTEDVLSLLAGMAGELVTVAAAVSGLTGSPIATTNASQLMAMSPTAYRTAALKSE